MTDFLSCHVNASSHKPRQCGSASGIIRPFQSQPQPRLMHMPIQSNPNLPRPVAVMVTATLVSGARCALLAAVLGCGLAQAQTFKDSALEALYVADKMDELKRLSTQRVAAQADDAQGVLGLALAALEKDDATARQNAIKQAQACIEKQARAAACQYALGVVLGVQAINEGMIKAARSAGAVKDALTAAHEIEPDWYVARSALMEFHLQAPGMMGGSKAKALELARGASKPDQARLLQARVLMEDKKLEEGLQAMVGMPTGLDFALASDLRGWATHAGMGLVSDKQAAKAQPLLERLCREHPGHAGPAYALGRALGETGAHEAALKSYEQAQAGKGASAWPVAYRIGMEQQALGRNDDAKASFKRYLATAVKGQQKQQDDARKRLEQMGG
jgi:tetratricopeptide (TPR) repeat protein